MTVWLTPDREVFFAGTYFPPRDGERGRTHGFPLPAPTLRRRLSRRTRPSIVAEVAQLTARVARGERRRARRRACRAAPSLDAAFARYRRALRPRPRRLRSGAEVPDAGRPPSSSCATTAAPGRRRRSRWCNGPSQVMAAGGVHDQLGGGFHRYATDAAWLIPHFEKMLYDNAQLASVYLMALQATGDATWGDVARAILDDVLRTLRAPERRVLGSRRRGRSWGRGDVLHVDAGRDRRGAHARPAVRGSGHYYGVDAAGNLGGRTVLRRRVPGRRGTPVPRHCLTDARARALAGARAARPAPSSTRRSWPGWNGLAISALARAGAVLDEPRYVAGGGRGGEVRPRPHAGEWRLLRVHADGSAGQAAFLEDHAFLAAGFLDLYEATFDLRWLTEARRAARDARPGFLRSRARRVLRGRRRCAIRDCRARSPPTTVRSRPGNAVAAENLVRLATFTDDVKRRGARGPQRASWRWDAASPRHRRALPAARRRRKRCSIGRVRSCSSNRRRVRLRPHALMRVVQTTYLPNRALVVTREGGDLAAAARRSRSSARSTRSMAARPLTSARRGRCLAPTSDPGDAGAAAERGPAAPARGREGRLSCPARPRYASAVAVALEGRVAVKDEDIRAARRQHHPYARHRRRAEGQLGTSGAADGSRAAWRTCSGSGTCVTIRGTRTGPIAIVSSCRPATAACCSTACCT